MMASDHTANHDAETINMQKSDRHIDVPGLINFRDMGGYKAVDITGRSRQTLSQKLYRSGHFHDVNDESGSCLSGLGIELIFDFRTAQEKLKRPSHHACLTTPHTIALELDPGSGASFMRMRPAEAGTPASMGAEQMHSMMCELNRSLVTDHIDTYRVFFQHILSRQPSVMVFHCASGKDRTGLAAVLLLSALGVDRETVLSDYLLTNACMDVKHHVARAMADFDSEYKIVMSEDALTALYEVRLCYIEAALEKIDQVYGGMNCYLTQQMQLDETALKKLQYLYLSE